MSGRLSPILGVISVLVFAVLVAVTVYGVVQGQEGTTEGPRPPGPHPLESLDPENLPESQDSFGLSPSYVGIGIEDVSVRCVDGAPRLWVRTRDPLPAGAIIHIIPQSAPIADTGGGSRYQLAGDIQYISVDQAGSLHEIVPSAAIARAAYHTLSVVVEAKDAEGMTISSFAFLLDAAEVRCEGSP